jgi:uncharacterized protein
VRLRREVLLASRVTHANVIRLHDLVTMDGVSFVTMELIQGTSLKSRIAARDLTLAECVDIARQCAGGLHAAHEAGVIHRDFKPENVLLEQGGRAVVVDFGVAGELIEGVTQASAIVGTTAYMSPEQANGQAPSPQTDLYALGLVLHEMLTGEIPLLGRGPVDTAMLRCFQPPPSVRDRRPDVPEGLAALILRMLSIDPAARPPSAAAVAAELLAPPDVAAVAPPAPRRRRSPLLLLVPFVLAAAVVAGIVALTGGGRGDEPEQQPAVTPAPVVVDAGPRTPAQLADACEHGEADTCSAAAEPLLFPGKLYEPVKGNRLLDLGCRGGDARACSRLAIAYRDGHGVVADPAKARAMFEAACAQSVGDACSAAGSMLSAGGPGVLADPVAAVKLFEKGCVLFSPAACTGLGIALQNGAGVNPDPGRAVQYFESECKHDYGPACLMLGAAYLTGRGVGKDEQRARALLKKSCDQDHAMGCDAYGQVLITGTGGPRDPAAAIAAFEKGCEKFAAKACEDLGLTYAAGDGVPVDESQAGIWFQLACEGGSMRSCWYSGVHFLTGKGATVDVQKGILLFERSCDGGFAQACWDLGGQYEHGIGVSKDPARATELRQKACQLDPKLPACR